MKKYIIILLLCLLKSNVVSANGFGFELTPIPASKFEYFLKLKKSYSQPLLNEIDDLNKVLELNPERLALKGELLVINNETNEQLAQIDLMYNGFIAYYPDDRVLYFEGGHNSDVVISLDSGLELEEVPKNRIYSPNAGYRISSYYNGQAPSSLIQKNTNGIWQSVSHLTESKLPYSFFMIDRFNWISETEFIFVNFEGKFYLGEIIRK
ncbi:hypothetical protein [Vibrio intestinalis]|uniref:hypothetical protein n=1 Tax=Vibrio intestinalis TaxID=2933291 RepID=UPI0021A7FFBD|nr:hypothetical protein [Vibrio intestinalis]